MRCELQRTRNYYLAQPCFILALEKWIGKPQRSCSLEELEGYYQFWRDGYRLGRYEEATKDAEGT